MNKSELNFIGLVATAEKLVKAAYPVVYFHGGIGNLTDAGSSTNAKEFTKWTFIFADGKTSDSICIQTGTVWGELQPPVLNKYPSGGNPIPWPVDLDLDAAAQLMQAEGYTQAFTSIALRWPVFDPPYTQPFYIFTLVNGQNIGVGIYDKNVRPF